jgi:hypothetical protein
MSRRGWWCSVQLDRRVWTSCTIVALVGACRSGPMSAPVPAPGPAPGPASARSTTAGAATTPDGALALLTALAHDSLEGRRAGSRGANKAAALIAAQMARVGLEPAGDSGYYQRLAGGTVNVVGLVRGSETAQRDEHVIVGAHYDHLGVGRAVDGDSIYNGADDDASGTITVLEAARQIAAGPRPRRTVVFIAFTGEEGGESGSGWYMEHPILPLSGAVAQLQIEMIGRPDSLAGGHGRAWLTGYERSTMGEALAAAGIPIVADPYPTQQFFFRSDNIRFAKRGIVAHTISSFNMHRDYHRPSDDVSRVDAAHIAAVINATTKAARLLADGERPTWKPNGKP